MIKISHETTGSEPLCATQIPQQKQRFIVQLLKVLMKNSLHLSGLIRNCLS